MQSVANKLRPKSGFSYFFHLGLNTLLPLGVFVFVRAGFSEVALLLILLSKWRMFALRPRYWLTNIRSNGVDIMVSISILIFMTHTDSALWQLAWAAFYIVWLTILKPGSSNLSVATQALIGEMFGLMAMFIWFSGSPLYQLIIVGWVVCYLAARHFFTVFDEPFTSMYSHTWAYFGASLIWVLGHWLLFYGAFAQPTVIITAISIGLASLYYLKQTDKLSSLLRRQIILVLLAMVVVIVVFSNWSSKII